MVPWRAWSSENRSRGAGRLRVQVPAAAAAKEPRGVRAANALGVAIARRSAATGFLYHGVDDVVVHAGFLQPDQVLGAGVEVGRGGADLAQDDLCGESGFLHWDNVCVGEHSVGGGPAIRRTVGAGTRLGFVDAGVAADVGGSFSTFFEGHLLAFHPHEDGRGRDRDGYTGATHVAFAFF